MGLEAKKGHLNERGNELQKPIIRLVDFDICYERCILN